MIADGYFSSSQANLFEPIIDSLLNKGDYYMLFADFESYVKCQEKVSETYKDKEKWTRMSILNVANMGKFSTDRTIKEYSDDIWNVKPVSITIK
jgi:starch phosphorylase